MTRLPLRLFAVLALSIAALALPVPASLAVDSPGAASPMNWRELNSPLYLWPADGAIYYSLKAKNGSKVHLVVADMKHGKWVLRPALNEPSAATSETAKRLQASAAVNGGFFNLSDGESTSFVVIDGTEVANPRTNKALTDNPKLAPYLETIFNRSEMRILKDKHGSQVIQISHHNDPVPQDMLLVHSLQGGPQLIPRLSDREEAFVRKEPDGKEVDSITAHGPAPRTAFGITSDGYAMLVCVSGASQESGSPGLTLSELAQLLMSLGCSQALNLDGGASSSMFVRLQAAGAPTGLTPEQTVCAKRPETRVKSILMLQRAASN